MANKLMTIKEVENSIGVSDVDSANWAKGVYIGANALRTGLAMAGVGSTGAGVVGVSMAIGAVAAPVLALVAALLAIGLPVAAAKEAVSKKAAKHGYAIGVALGLFNHDRYFLSTFVDNTWGSPGVGPSYMTGVYKHAYNASLVLGYCCANQLNPEEKKRAGERVLMVMMEDAKRKGYKLNVNGWTERDAVHYFARTFINRVMK